MGENKRSSSKKDSRHSVSVEWVAQIITMIICFFILSVCILILAHIKSSPNLWKCNTQLTADSPFPSTPTVTTAVPAVVPAETSKATRSFSPQVVCGKRRQLQDAKFMALDVAYLDKEGEIAIEEMSEFLEKHNMVICKSFNEPSRRREKKEPFFEPVPR